MSTSSSPSDNAHAVPTAPQGLQRNVSIDLLKLVLAFMVVGLHTGFAAELGPTVTYLTGNGLFRIAVPLFLIINGFYFYPVLQRGEARRWFGRVIGLYLFWTLIYSYFWLPPLGMNPAGIAKALHTIAIGYFHLWYLCGMIGAALMTLMLKGARLRTMVVILIGLYGSGVLIQYAGNYHAFDNASLDLVANRHWAHRNFLFLSFPFFYIGYAISQYQLQKRITVTQASLGVFIGIVILLIESLFNFRNPENDGGFDNFASLLIVCPAIFLCVCNLKLYSANKRISLYSSGIFLVHVFVLYILQPHVKVSTTILTFLVLSMSIAVTAALIPLSRKVKFIL